MERMFLALFGVAIAVSSFAQQSSPTELRLARYTTAAGVPAEAETNPLQTVITVAFPRQHITTVAQAVDYLLIRTGYRLGRTSDKEVEEVLALALPEVHRRMGPYSVEAALRTLLGEPFTLAIDPRRREVTYRLSQAATNVATTTGQPSPQALEPATKWVPMSTSGPPSPASSAQPTPTSREAVGAGPVPISSVD